SSRERRGPSGRGREGRHRKSRRRKGRESCCREGVCAAGSWPEGSCPSPEAASAARRRSFVIETLLFWTCGLCVCIGALGAATVRNLFHAALLLGLSLVGVAGLYLFLGAHWLACVQVVVYVGGILVLILFSTLFSADVMGLVQRTPWLLRIAGGLGALLSAVV